MSARMILVSIRDVETNVVKRKQIKNITTIPQFKEEVKRLFNIDLVGSIMFQGIDLREGTLESNGVDEGCLIDIVGEVVGA